MIDVHIGYQKHWHPLWRSINQCLSSANTDSKKTYDRHYAEPYPGMFAKIVSLTDDKKHVLPLALIKMLVHTPTALAHSRRVNCMGGHTAIHVR